MIFSAKILRNTVYSVLDVITKRRGIGRRIGGQFIRFPVRWSRYYEADYEPGTFAFFRATLKPGDVVMDIGAHMGLFTVVAANRVGGRGRVFAFEPTPSTRAVLERVVSLNHISRIVEVRGEAISGTNGTATFHETGDEVSNANSLVSSGRSQSGFVVKTQTVDDFVREHSITPNFLKIDVEGAEGDVLRGAENTFLRARPIALLAIHPETLMAGDTLHSVWELLQKYQMRVSLLREGRDSTNLSHFGHEVDETWFCAQTDQFDVQLHPKPIN